MTDHDEIASLRSALAEAVEIMKLLIEYPYDDARGTNETFSILITHEEYSRALALITKHETPNAKEEA